MAGKKDQDKPAMDQGMDKVKDKHPQHTGRTPGLARRKQPPPPDYDDPAEVMAHDAAKASSGVHMHRARAAVALPAKG